MRSVVQVKSARQESESKKSRIEPTGSGPDILTKKTVCLGWHLPQPNPSCFKRNSHPLGMIGGGRQVLLSNSKHPTHIRAAIGC
jgi:hypothetical protein